MTVRILHVVGRMDRGGIETWLMHILRRIDRQAYHMDFLVTQNGRAGHYDDEIRSLGSGIIVCPDHERPLLFARHFKRIMREHGPYDVVHGHTYLYSGVVMALAARAGVPLRIAHSHDERHMLASERRLARRLYRTVMKALIRRYAVLKLATSRPAAADMFGQAWQRRPDTRVVHCGLDFSPFLEEWERAATRRELGLPSEAVVMGHVGRFVAQKNQSLVIEIAAEAARRDDRVRLLLIGEGPMRAEIEALARARGIADRVVFAGVRDDVPRLMSSAMDVFILPSLHEGLGLVAVEAQAAGIPCVLADTVPAEADIVPRLIRRLPLEAPPSEWASEALAAVESRPARFAEAIREVLASDFNIERCVQDMMQIYNGVPRTVA